jgi:small subunit ribosomal protein S16
LVKIRLRRIGAKKQPSYRLVVADSRAPRDGAFIAVIGHYNPLTNPETLVIDEEEASAWLKQGAQPTDTAARLLAKAGIIEEPEARKEKMKAGAPAKAKAEVPEPKAEAEVPEPKAEAEVPEPKAEAEVPEPKAEAEVTEPEAAEETKAEATEEVKAEATEEPEAATEEAKAEAGEEQTETTKEAT